MIAEQQARQKQRQAELEAWRGLPDEERAFREAMVKAGASDEALNAHRELCITEFDGCYGRAGIVIAVNGSPPRGLVIAFPAAFGSQVDEIILKKGSRVSHIYKDLYRRGARQALLTATEALLRQRGHIGR